MNTDYSRVTGANGMNEFIAFCSSSSTLSLLVTLSWGLSKLFVISRSHVGPFYTCEWGPWEKNDFGILVVTVLGLEPWSRAILKYLLKSSIIGRNVKWTHTNWKGCVLFINGQKRHPFHILSTRVWGLIHSNLTSLEYHNPFTTSSMIKLNLNKTGKIWIFVFSLSKINTKRNGFFLWNWDCWT